MPKLPAVAFASTADLAGDNAPKPSAQRLLAAGSLDNLCAGEGIGFGHSTREASL
jgi:hypothetical protein